MVNFYAICVGGVRACVVLAAIALVSGCASAVHWEDAGPERSRAENPSPGASVPPVQSPRVVVPSRQPNDAQLPPMSRSVASGLHAFYQSWKGVPYQFGGSTRSGIDCSALTQRAMSEVMDVTLPRTTRQQILQGVSISEDQLVSGDLVFFKTGEALNHVGVMLGSTQFLHASTRHGVTLSSLDETYWKTRVIGFRRVRP